MRKRVSIFFLITLMVGNGFIITGCKTKKKIIALADKKPLFNVVGYAKSAPFSPDPNFYCFLEVIPSSYISDQVDYVIVFKKLGGETCVIYKNVDQEKYLICDSKIKERKKIRSAEDVLVYEKEIEVLKNYKFEILDQKVTLDDVECVLFNWHSGGVKFFSYKNFREGIIGSFGYKIGSKYDSNNSGKAIFTEWDKNDENWPEVKEMQFPLKK